MTPKTLIYLEDAIQVIRDHIYAHRELADNAYKASIRMEDIELIRKTPTAFPVAYQIPTTDREGDDETD